MFCRRGIYHEVESPLSPATTMCKHTAAFSGKCHLDIAHRRCHHQRSQSVISTSQSHLEATVLCNALRQTTCSNVCNAAATQLLSNVTLFLTQSNRTVSSMKLASRAIIAHGICDDKVSGVYCAETAHACAHAMPRLGKHAHR